MAKGRRLQNGVPLATTTCLIAAVFSRCSAQAAPGRSPLSLATAVNQQATSELPLNRRHLVQSATLSPRNGWRRRIPRLPDLRPTPYPVMGDHLEIVQRFAAWISVFTSFRTILSGMITVSIKQMSRAELKNSASFLHA
jgi:hypothetical protein